MECNLLLNYLTWEDLLVFQFAEYAEEEVNRFQWNLGKSQDVYKVGGY